MSSPGSSLSAAGPPQDQRESGSYGGSETAWHPAREWLEGDEDEDEDEDEEFQPWSDGEDNDEMEDIWEEDDPSIRPGRNGFTYLFIPGCSHWFAWNRADDTCSRS